MKLLVLEFVNVNENDIDVVTCKCKLGDLFISFYSIPDFLRIPITFLVYSYYTTHLPHLTLQPPYYISLLYIPLYSLIVPIYTAVATIIILPIRFHIHTCHLIVLPVRPHLHVIRPIICPIFSILHQSSHHTSYSFPFTQVPHNPIRSHLHSSVTPMITLPTRPIRTHPPSTRVIPTFVPLHSPFVPIPLLITLIPRSHYTPLVPNYTPH